MAFPANRAEARAANLLPYFVPYFLRFSKILKALANPRGLRLLPDFIRGWYAVGTRSQALLKVSPPAGGGDLEGGIDNLPHYQIHNKVTTQQVKFT